jgi:hypothetical protein
MSSAGQVRQPKDRRKTGRVVDVEPAELAESANKEERTAIREGDQRFSNSSAVQ